jgi:hypothetical protein
VLRLAFDRTLPASEALGTKKDGEGAEEGEQEPIAHGPRPALGLVCRGTLNVRRYRLKVVGPFRHPSAAVMR